jgi:hypothetical protein
MIKSTKGNNWEVGMNNIDTVFLADYVDALASQMADEEAEKQKKRLNQGAGGFEQ